MGTAWRMAFAALVGGAFIGLSGAAVFADEPLTVELTIREHRFEPPELRVPAGKPFVIRVKNLDATAEEFESSALKIEKVIAGGAEGTVRSRGLAAGRYEFEGEFHADTAKGVIIAE